MKKLQENPRNSKRTFLRFFRKNVWRNSSGNLWWYSTYNNSCSRNFRRNFWVDIWNVLNNPWKNFWRNCWKVSESNRFSRVMKESKELFWKEFIEHVWKKSLNKLMEDSHEKKSRGISWIFLKESREKIWWNLWKYFCIYRIAGNRWRKFSFRKVPRPTGNRTRHPFTTVAIWDLPNRAANCFCLVNL